MELVHRKILIMNLREILHYFKRKICLEEYH